jgi:hypothetical protein
MARQSPEFQELYRLLLSAELSLIGNDSEAAASKLREFANKRHVEEYLSNIDSDAGRNLDDFAELLRSDYESQLRDRRRDIGFNRRPGFFQYVTIQNTIITVSHSATAEKDIACDGKIKTIDMTE